MNPSLSLALIISLAASALPAQASDDAWQALRGDDAFVEAEAGSVPMQFSSLQPVAIDDVTIALDETAAPLPAVTEQQQPDWSLLDGAYGALPALNARKPSSKPIPIDKANWTSNRKANASTAITVVQPISPFMQARVGADISVSHARAFASTREALLDQYGSRDPVDASSGGSAWVAMNAPTLGNLWDNTVIRGQFNPEQQASNWSTHATKTLKIDDAHALAIQQELGLYQQGAGLPTGFKASDGRVYSASQSARLSFSKSGTHLIAGQVFSTSAERLLHRLAAEQELYKGVNVSAAVSETVGGPANKTFRASFNTKW